MYKKQIFEHSNRLKKVENESFFFKRNFVCFVRHLFLSFSVSYSTLCLNCEIIALIAEEKCGLMH